LCPSCKALYSAKQLSFPPLQEAISFKLVFPPLFFPFFPSLFQFVEHRVFSVWLVNPMLAYKACYEVLSVVAVLFFVLLVAVKKST
jgi:hypothetical protein